MTSEAIKRGFANKKSKLKDLSDKSETKKVGDNLKSGLDDYLSGKKITQTIVGEPSAPESVSDLLKKASSEYEKRLKGESIEKDVEPAGNEEANEVYKGEESAGEEHGSYKAINSTGELIGELKKIEEDYSKKSDFDYYADQLEEIKPTLGLEPKEMPKTTAEDILAESYGEVKDSYEKDVKKQVQKAEKGLDSANDDVMDLVNEIMSDTEKVQNDYDLKKQEYSDESLRRGLARSSVAILGLDGLEKEEREVLSNMTKEFNDALDNYEKEIGGLKKELDDALSEMDIELAIEINELVKEKEQELEKEKAKVAEYNEKIVELEKEYQAELPSLYKKQEKQKEKLAEEYKGINKKTMQEEMFNIALNYYSGIDKDVALNELSTNSELARLLGQRIYDVYYKILKQK